MASPMHEGPVSLMHRGQLDVAPVRNLAAGDAGLTKKPVKFRLSDDRITEAPGYRRLSRLSGRVVLRLNASCGCLSDCSFREGSWSSKYSVSSASTSR